MQGYIAGTVVVPRGANRKNKEVELRMSSCRHVALLTSKETFFFFSSQALLCWLGHLLLNPIAVLLGVLDTQQAFLTVTA